jgi:predicted signal transduction protein with EAL and GGDEF domain
VVKVTASIGIALGHGLTSTADALLKRADSALYAAKVTAATRSRSRSDPSAGAAERVSQAAR